ncbi:NAD(P)H-hydrate dehydratase [Algoriphagus lacus]|uniref:Bifunctional NAD(P)H-hydrate repair enzyme n=1 Tax=Algoriphagus lacus TaxID=2056311 RepID=A0A418PPL8_9BACT|nr:NAD(P)H-hydrate dehydratase [Algoriphagus lacus]RIW14029.1 NAD(P)H-hydrate dehydratase [Algoriphagus lacus]
MLKILSGNQVKKLDSAHLELKVISSFELMERAAVGFSNWWKSKLFSKNLPVFVFCGAGNNGGDGFAIARLLHKMDYTVSVFKCFEDRTSLSEDAGKNYALLSEGIEIKSWQEFDPTRKGILIDAFLGVGFKGALRSDAEGIIEKINSFTGKIIAVDIPSGLPSDDVLKGNCVRASITVTFAFPKLSLLFPEHARNVGEIVLVDIGISDGEYDSFSSSFFYLRDRDISGFHREFHRFSHKGDFGKVLLIGGSKGKMGAVVLSSKSALRTGSGLVSCKVDSEERLILQTAVPEAMCRLEEKIDYREFDAIGVGPGLGTEGKTALLEDLFERYSKPLVLDADAINLLALNQHLIPMIPKNSILTPHLGEFDRLLGTSVNHLERLEKAFLFCKKWGLNLVIKGANSVICLADGRQIFNSSGTKYMATGGSGDVLTGILTSFLGQSYSPEQALICGVFHHGLAGELAGKIKRRGTIASDIIEAIPDTFIQLDIS